MVLTEKGRALCIRETVTYRLDKSGGETANLIRFLDPDNIAGTGFLSIDKADGAQAVKERHRLLGRQTENGILCEVLESVPALLGLRLRKPRQAVTAP